MLTPLLNLGAGLVYLGTGGILIKTLYDNSDETPRKRQAILLWVAAGVILHAAVLLSTLVTDGNINLGFTNAASLVAWVIAALFLATSLARPIETLGVFILPLAALAVLAAWFWPAHEAILPANSTVFAAHLVVSILAYAFLTMAMAQALLYALQERRFRQRHPGRLFHALPPLETMERLLFQLIGVGFVLLTVTLVSGVFFTRARYGAAVVFNHHTVLSLVAWVIFGILLLGRWRFGWRGKSAIRWTLGGCLVLALAYFGTKFIVEFLIN